MRKILYQSAIALAVLGGAALATAPAFARDRYVYVGPEAVVPPIVAFDPYGPAVVVEPDVPAGPPVTGYAAPDEELAPVGPEAEYDYGPPAEYGPPAGPAIEVGGY
jgi:hypothetical protein